MVGRRGHQPGNRNDDSGTQASTHDGDGLTLAIVWSEVFARCDAPTVVAVWSDPAGVTLDGKPWRPESYSITYQREEDGGCSNTDVRVLPNGVGQFTGMRRQTTSRIGDPHRRRIRGLALDRSSLRLERSDFEPGFQGPGAQLVGVAHVGERGPHCDPAREHEILQSLVEGVHAEELGLLHNLVDGRREVDVQYPLADAFVVGEEFGRQHPRSAVAGLEEPLAQDHSQVRGELATNEVVFGVGEESDETGDGVGRVDGVHRGDHEVPGLGSPDGSPGSLDGHRCEI